jgi:hypothetical protein
VSVATGGAQANSISWFPSISADGRFVAFSSDSTNLVAGDSNLSPDTFLHDRSSGTTERISVSTSGMQASSAVSHPTTSISADGRVVAFDSDASNLVAADANGVIDAFVRDRGVPPVSYCTAGTTTHGCAAQISASANPSVAFAHACQITIANVEGQQIGIVFYGIDNAGFSSAIWAPGSTSVRCVKYPVQRTPVQNSGGTLNACNGVFALDWNAYQTTHPLALGNPWSVGDRVYIQAWFRDPPAVKSTNLSNAVEMTYEP